MASPQPTNPALGALTPQQIADFREAFSLFDTNGDNSISSTEIKQIFAQLGESITDAQLSDILAEYDIDKSGSIDFEEFLLMMANKVSDTGLSQTDLEEEISSAFKMFDSDGNGFIDVKELRQALAKLGETLSEEEAQQMLDEADTNHDGFLDISEFKNIMTKF